MNAEGATGAARHTDPDTSHAAAAVVNVNRLERVIICTLEEYGPLTMSEIAKATSEERDSLSPRMKRLVKILLVIDTGNREVPKRFGLEEKRKNTAHNNSLIEGAVNKRSPKQIVWAVTRAGSDLAESLKKKN